MLEPEDCQIRVLEILNDSSKRDMCRLRTELFMVAANSTNAEMCLVPFPACYFDRTTKTKKIDFLKEQIQQVPKLSEIDETTKMDSNVWELLYWVFTNPLTIRPSYACKEMLDSWSKETRLDLSRIWVDYPDRCNLYTVVNPTPKKEFIQGKAKYGSSFAFHGSPLDNFHSIVHRGLLAVLNKRSAYGVGSYLSSSFNISQRYSGLGAGWKDSEIGRNIRCIAICEIVDDPSGVRKEYYRNPRDSEVCLYYVVAKDELIQLSHLIVVC